ncbi:MAG: hypothetical protein KF795_18275 [Labilithrix sp.]|nr:hypothetical protein [Labilithrix sp.]
MLGARRGWFVLACGVVLFSASCGLAENPPGGASGNRSIVEPTPSEPVQRPPATGWGDIRVMSHDGQLALSVAFTREPPPADPSPGACRLVELKNAVETASLSAGAITLGVGASASPVFTFEPAEYTSYARGMVAPTPPAGTPLRLSAPGAEVPPFEVWLFALEDVKLVPQRGASLDGEGPLTVRWESDADSEDDLVWVSLGGTRHMALCPLEASARNVVVPSELVRAVSAAPGTPDCDDCLWLQVVASRRAEVRAGPYAVVARYETYASETLKLR